MKMKKLFSLALCLLTVGVSGQSISTGPPEIIPPSPTVAALMHFEEVPVSLYTGTPQISIPLISKNIGSGLQMNLQLAYNTAGIRVDDRSGWTGTGWSLFAGGSVSRTVRDVADETNEPGAKVGVWHNNYFNYETFSNNELDEFLFKANGGTEKFDSQVDLFQFSAMGRSGRFIILRNGQGDLEARQISSDSKYRISL